MLRALRIVFRAISSPLGRLLIRGSLGLVLVVWLLDRFVFVTTEYLWWQHLGFGAALRERWAAQGQLFLLGFVSCFILVTGSLSPLLTPLESEPPLPAALRFLQNYRGATRPATWGVLIMVAVWDACAFTSQWPAWLRFGAHSSWEYQVPFYGLPVDVWLCRLPFFLAYVGLLWHFSWLVLCVVVLAGLLHSLPLLAARVPEIPERFIRVVWRLIAWLFLLRGAGYLLEMFQLATVQFNPAGLYLGRTLCLAGAMGCLVLALRSSVRRSFRRPGRQFFLTTGLALFGPFLLQLLFSPFLSFFDPGGRFQTARESATTAAWRLSSSPLKPGDSERPHEAWTAWDEPVLLQWLNSLPRFDKASAGRPVKSRVLDWTSVNLQHSPKEGWKALAIGRPSEFDAWNASHEADVETSLEVAEVRLDPASVTGPLMLKMQPIVPAYYGLDGPALVGAESQGPGVAFRSWTLKMAWAWRLRNPFLLLEARRGERLLVYRGLAESVSRLAPFLTPSSAPRPFWSKNRLYWAQTFTAPTAFFPASATDPQLAFGGATAAADAVRVTQDAATGELRFSLLTPPVSGQRSWEVPLSNLLGHGEEMPVETVVPGGMISAQARIIGEMKKLPVESLSPVALPRLARGFALETSRDEFRLYFPNLESGPARLQDWQAAGEMSARLQDLDKEYQKYVSNQDATARTDYRDWYGEPAVWPDKAAPGGWWIARSYFLVPILPVAGPGSADRPVLLFGVALAGATGPVTIRRSLSEAWTALEAANPSLAAQSRPRGPNPLAAKALELHNMALEALSQGNSARFGELMRQEKELLERMAR